MNNDFCGQSLFDCKVSPEWRLTNVSGPRKSVPLIEVSQRWDSTAVWGSLFSRVALFRENIFPFSFRRGGWGGRKKWNWKECVCRNAFSAKIPLILNSSNDGLRCNEPRSSLRTGTYFESHLCKKDSMPAKSLHYKFRKLYYPTLVSVWCSAGEEKQKFAWDWGRESSESTEKRCCQNSL